MRVNKKDLAIRVSDRMGLRNFFAKRLVSVVLDEIIKAIEDGDSVSLHGLGTFSVRQYAPRKGFDPWRKEPATFAARKGVVFNPSRRMKGRLNQI